MLRYKCKKVFSKHSETSMLVVENEKQTKSGNCTNTSNICSRYDRVEALPTCLSIDDDSFKSRYLIWIANGATYWCNLLNHNLLPSCRDVVRLLLLFRSLKWCKSNNIFHTWHNVNRNEQFSFETVLLEVEVIRKPNSLSSKTNPSTCTKRKYTMLPTTSAFHHADHRTGLPAATSNMTLDLSLLIKSNECFTSEWFETAFSADMSSS